jgi:predicted transposase/invertase (TIGR01784 family)
MPTLAQQFREEFIETLGPELKKEGKKEEQIEIARRMLLNDFSVKQVIISTGLTEEEIKTLIN